MVLSLFRKDPLPQSYQHPIVGLIPIRIHSRAKRLTLKFGPNTGFSVTAAPSSKKADLVAFLDRYDSWITQQNQKRNQIDTSTILFQGKPYTIKTATVPGRSLYQLDHDKHQLIIDKTLFQDRLNTRFIFHREFKKTLPEILKKKTIRMNLYPKKISIRDTKSRWGSCSSEGNISLSWRLMMAPPDVMEYVIIHELAHLQHMNHSKSFWQLVAQYCPNYRHHIHWLKMNGSKIMAI